MRLFRLFLFVFSLFILGLNQPAFAAPQIIAVLPSDSGVPFFCADGTCRANLSTYCLQRERPPPSTGAVYVPAAREDFRLIIATASGPKSISIGDDVTFVESRGFLAVAAEIDEARLRALAGGDPKAVLRVGRAASLLPEAVKGDPNPLTEKEIAYVTKWRRGQGTLIVDQSTNARTVKVLAGLTNRLPTFGSTDFSRVSHIWEQAIGDEYGTATPAESEPGLARAQLELRRCSQSASRYSYGGLRQCLEYRHDDLIRDLNIEYWDAKPGS
ncbi:MAG: hypothetical protein HOH04_17165 [Rhodospirillaceae bacterium]|nr:hypothetical protein [Rhodospirillaceae bacterium]